MIQQVSDFELELMKTIWGNGGTALYAEIAEALEKKGTPATKNTIISLLSRPQRRLYISMDEIDSLLRGGKRSADYRLAVYSFYRNTQTAGSARIS